MKYSSRLLRGMLIAGVLVFMSSCNLFKISLASETEPLTKQELNTRLAVRSFYSQFAQAVIQTSDSILVHSENHQVAINALLWKINSTSAASKAAYQTIPEASLIDVWALTYQMDDLMRSAYADSLFGEHKEWAQKASGYLKKSADQMARSLSKKDRYEKLSAFVRQYSRNHKLNDLQFVRGNVLPELTSYLGIPDSAYVSSIGSASEVMNDLTERISIVNEQIQNQIEWQKQLFTVKWDNDSLSDQIFARTDSLSLMMNRLVILARESPEMLGTIAVRLREELGPMLMDLGTQMNMSILQLSRQREELQRFIDEQRALVAQEINQTSDKIIAAAADSVVKIIRNLILYFILLILVLFGVPFGLGYSFGRMRLRRKQSEIKKQN